MELASVHRRGHHRGASLDLRSTLGLGSGLHVKTISSGLSAPTSDQSSSADQLNQQYAPTAANRELQNGCSATSFQVRLPGGAERITKGGTCDSCGSSSVTSSYSSDSSSCSTAKCTGGCGAECGPRGPPTPSLISSISQQHQHVRNLSLDSALQQQQRQLQQLQQHQQHLPLSHVAHLSGGHPPLLQVS